MAQGFTQTPGVDYFDTFCLVAKPCTIQLILALAISFGWPIRQLDVENAFLNGDLQEEVFMFQPPGFVDPQFPNCACRLNKALYGLKQAPKAWFHKLRMALLQFGFQSSREDASLFIYHTTSDTALILVYVDDILVTTSNFDLLSQVISFLYTAFPIRDLGKPFFFLGLQVQFIGGAMHLSHLKYIQDSLERTHLEDSKPTLLQVVLVGQFHK